MYPLIEIKTVPIEIQMKTRNATLEYSRGTAEMEVSRSDGGGLDIKSRPIRLRLDSFEARNSINPTTMRSVKESASKGRQAAYEATATYARQGDLFLNAKLGEDVVGQIAKQNVDKRLQSELALDFTPDPGIDVDWEEGDIQIRYEMEQMNLDWKISKGEFKRSEERRVGKECRLSGRHHQVHRRSDLRPALRRPQLRAGRRPRVTDARREKPD